ncbi:uncharacterized protein LOC107484784 [Arachis duranensis]|uniref:Uncharacterized protein LOC107484784 n=1 Tax=Arachis duranensis TaxID=130453 RepID=A0A6P4D7Y7_ARADU|nr:uncharacterized protein LOC107484784 [Arachis duranensis]
MAAMANLVNTMEANAAATLQTVQRLAQPTGSRNKNGECTEDSLSGVPKTLAAFLKANPPAFNGSTAPTEADNWFQAVEQEAFYKKYSYESLREARELELLQLKQGSMTIAEYTSKFEEFFRFSKISQGTSESYEEWKCVKYEVGLREDIRRVVAPLEIRRFSKLVDKARVVEEHAKTVVSSRDTHRGNTSRELDDYLGPRGQNFKKDGHTPQHLLGQENFRRDNNAQLHRMKGSHLCFTCGLPGNLAKNCHRKKN